MKALILAAIIANVTLTGCGDKEAFVKGNIAELECKSQFPKPEGLIPNSKGEVKYKIRIQNCTKTKTATFNNFPSAWAEAKVKYNLK